MHDSHICTNFGGVTQFELVKSINMLVLDKKIIVPP